METVIYHCMVCGTNPNPNPIKKGYADDKLAAAVGEAQRFKRFNCVHLALVKRLL